MIFASFFDGFPVVERARNTYYVGLPVLSNALCWAPCLRPVRRARETRPQRVHIYEAEVMVALPVI